jgi:hypothetical protein
LKEDRKQDKRENISAVLSNLISIERYGVIYLAPFVAFRISCATSFECDTGDVWLDASEIVLALICFANICSAAGGIRQFIKSGLYPQFLNETL